MSNSSVNSLSRSEIYSSLISLLDEVKLVQGPQAVYATLRRHKEVYKFILLYQQTCLKEVEGFILDFDN